MNISGPKFLTHHNSDIFHTRRVFGWRLPRTCKHFEFWCSFRFCTPDKQDMELRCLWKWWWERRWRRARWAVWSTYRVVPSRVRESCWVVVISIYHSWAVMIFSHNVVMTKAMTMTMTMTMTTISHAWLWASDFIMTIVIVMTLSSGEAWLFMTFVSHD